MEPSQLSMLDRLACLMQQVGVVESVSESRATSADRDRAACGCVATGRCVGAGSVLALSTMESTLQSTLQRVLSSCEGHRREENRGMRTAVDGTRLTCLIEPESVDEVWHGVSTRLFSTTVGLELSSSSPFRVVVSMPPAYPWLRHCFRRLCIGIAASGQHGWDATVECSQLSTAAVGFAVCSSRNRGLRVNSGWVV